MLFVLAARREAPPAVGPGDAPGRARDRDSGVLGRRLPVRHCRGGLAGHDICVPAQFQRPDHPVRLPADRHLADRAALPHATTPSCASRCGCSRCCRSSRHAGDSCGILVQMYLDRRTPVAAGAEPVVLGRGVGVVLRQQMVRESPPCGSGGRRRRRSLRRVLVVANQTVNSNELLDELRRIGADTAAQPILSSCRPARSTPESRRPTDPSTCRRPPSKPPRSGWTTRWPRLRSENLDADGALGDSSTAAGAVGSRRLVRARSDRDCDVAARVLGVASIRRRRPRPCPASVAGDPCQWPAPRWPVGPSCCPSRGARRRPERRCRPGIASRGRDPTDDSRRGRRRRRWGSAAYAQRSRHGDRLAPCTFRPASARKCLGP